MYDGAKELAQGESDYSKYAILPDNQVRTSYFVQYVSYIWAGHKHQYLAT